MVPKKFVYFLFHFVFSPFINKIAILKKVTDMDHFSRYCLFCCQLVMFTFLVSKIRILLSNLSLCFCVIFQMIHMPLQFLVITALDCFYLFYLFICYFAETTFEVIPRLSKIKFDSGILDELLFLEKPHECRLASGIMLLEYAKVTEESIYDHMRVVREGQLRIIFTPDLKVTNWHSFG